MSTESDKKSDEMPEFFQEKKEKPVKKELNKRTFGLKKKQAGTELAKKTETSLVDPTFNRNKLFSKGINRMADEKLEDASHLFEMILRLSLIHI